MTAKQKELMKREPQAPAQAEPDRSGYTHLPPVDIYETSENWVLVADMPGVDKADLSVTLENDVLEIEGRVKDEAPADPAAARREYGVGSYHRTFTVSRDVDRDNVKAHLKDGVLRVMLNKAEAAKPHRIEVATA